MTFPSGESAAHDDELATEYEAPGHTAPIAGCPNCARLQREFDAVMSLAAQIQGEMKVFNGAVGEHTFKIESMRLVIENLRAELASARERLETETDGD